MASVEWWAEGDLFEGCNCDVLCPCHVSFRQNSTNATCDGAWGARIESGQYGEVTLNDLNAMVVYHCPGPSMFDGNWTGLIYTDDRATLEQRTALSQILSGTGGGPWERIAQFFTEGKPRLIAEATFKFTKESRKRFLEVTLDVTNLASLEVEALRGADRDEEVRITNLYNVVHGPEHTIARSKLSVDAAGLRWDNSGKHGLYSRFRWSGP